MEKNATLNLKRKMQSDELVFAALAESGNNPRETVQAAPCVETGLFMKRNILNSGLVVFSKSGHTINVEETKFFNWSLLDFLTSVDAESW